MNNLWTIEANTASFQQAHSTDRETVWKGSLELESPEKGLTIRCTGDKETRIFPIEIAAPVIPYLHDCFVREGDLIVSYPQREPRDYSIQLDYRLLPIHSEIRSAQSDTARAIETGLLIELWISLQTFYLDTHPSVIMKLHLHRNSAPPSRHPIAILSGACPPSGLHVNYMVDPHDQRDTCWEHHEQIHTAKFFGHFMEKGVIRRARLRCLVTELPVCSDFIADQYQQLVRSPLPLTA